MIDLVTEVRVQSQSGQVRAEGQGMRRQCSAYVGRARERSEELCAKALADTAASEVGSSSDDSAAATTEPQDRKGKE